MAKRKGGGAPIGNKNAAGPRTSARGFGGARAGFIGSAFGPIGAFAGGLYGNKKGYAVGRRAARYAGLTGMVSGGIFGGAAGLIGGIGAPIGALSGATIGGLTNYAAGRLGNRLGAHRKNTPFASAPLKRIRKVKI